MDQSDLRERLEQRLMSHGVYVTDLDASEGTLRIEYETATPGDGVPHREVGRVLNRLLEAYDDGWDATDVRGVVSDIDDGEATEGPRTSEDERSESAGTVRGTWRADGDWLVAHANDDISDVELSQRVLDTIDET